MATLGLSKVFILDKYFTELQKFWETEKKLQDASSNEAVHLQQRLKSLSTELVTLRNRLHVGQQVGGPGVVGQGGGVINVPTTTPGAIGLGGAPQRNPNQTKGQMIVAPNTNDLANNKVYGSSATAPSANNNNNCHTTSYPPPTILGPVKSPQSTNLNGGVNAHSNGPTGNNNQGYVPVITPRNTSIPMPLPDFGAAAPPPDPPVLQTLAHSMPATNHPHLHSLNHPQQQLSMISPPLPIPSTTTVGNHFNPIQSPPQAPGITCLQAKNSTGAQLAQGLPNSINSRILPNKFCPPHGTFNEAPQTLKLMDQEQLGGFKTNPRIVGPKSYAVSYSNQMPQEGHGQIVEARQRSEKVPLTDIDDMINLSGPLTEDAVMKTLLMRFQNESFYTNIGPILLAINPYLAVGNPLTLTSIRSLPLAPQMKKIVQETVRQQTETGYPQAIILSGTSGSGKTHCSMLLLRELFDVAGGGHETDAFKHLAAAFTVLRSLGSAKTATNSESSRIGQFIEVQVTDGALYRTKIHCYFLDQTRVIRPLANEKNYHIFYQMLAGLSQEERKRLNLEGYSIHNLNYLQSGDKNQNEQEDAIRFQAWKTCLGILGIPFLDVVRVLSAVLLLGNVQFVDGLGLEVDIKGEAELNAVADLLGVPAQALFRGLTTRTHNARGKLVKSVCDANMSNMTRDCLSKALYCRTVATIVRRANSLKRLGSTLGTLSSDSNESVHNQADVASQHASTIGGGNVGSKSMAALNNAVRHATDGFIGILDMFGFEEPRPSHLEHLCINLCAETMQHFYNTHIFKSSVESCRDEGIHCDTEIDYVDNVPCIDLISSLRTGLLSMLDTECSIRGTAESYVAKIKVQHRNSSRLESKNASEPTNPRVFTIRHFAGSVDYDCTSFLDTNRDVVPDDLVSVFFKNFCNFGFVTHLFGSELKALYASENVPRGQSFRIAPTSHTDVLNGDEPISTLTQDFHTRLDNLLRTLVHARPHFIRCIRSNSNETAKSFDRSAVVKQIRSMQVLETVNLMASGFPHRMRFKQFNSRYRMLAPFNLLKRCDDKVLDDCKFILKLALKNPPVMIGSVSLAWAPGKRHIFLSEGIRQHLERMRCHIRTRSATLIQGAWRNWQRRRRVNTAQRPMKNESLMGNKPMNILPISRINPNPMKTGTIARPRPQPIAGTPPPDPNEKCDSKIIQQTCTLFGLDLERPPPVPPSRSYTVTGNSKLSYPQIRLMKMNFPEDAAVGGQASEQLRKGEAVSVVGASERRGHLIVDHAGRQWTVPFQFMELVKSTSDCIATGVATASLASVDI